MKSFDLSTRGHESLIDITPQVRKAIEESGVRDGMCIVYCPHTTAAITINENADADVPRDILLALDRAVPLEVGYQHREGNSAAHVKSSLIGASCIVPVADRKPILGTWQSVFFCEFDGPRQRRVVVQVL